MKITVGKLNSTEAKVYNCDNSKLAVLTAHAESLGDYDYNNYEKKYKDECFKGRTGYLCGQFIVYNDNRLDYLLENKRE